jgi:hypothetical protein
MTTARKEDYINPIADGMLSWRSVISCDSESDTKLKNWQQRLHELSTRRCARMTCMLRWVGTEVREPPNLYGLNDLEYIFMKYEVEVMENQRLPTLYISLKDTPTIWCGTHKVNINNCIQ